MKHWINVYNPLGRTQFSIFLEMADTRRRSVRLASDTDLAVAKREAVAVLGRMIREIEASS